MHAWIEMSVRHGTMRSYAVPGASSGVMGATFGATTMRVFQLPLMGNGFVR